MILFAGNVEVDLKLSQKALGISKSFLSRKLFTTTSRRICFLLGHDEEQYENGIHHDDAQVSGFIQVCS